MKRVTAALVASILLGSANVEAGSAGKAAARGLIGGLAAKGGSTRVAEAVQRDLLRDRATRARPLTRPRTVERYTTRERARREIRHGLRPGQHMAPAHPGRPLRPDHASKRYGLPGAPEVRESIRLPAGQSVRSNKALGGKRGVGEITSPRSVPPEAIKKVSPLPSPRTSAH